jgi:hypothetical protein
VTLTRSDVGSPAFEDAGKALLILRGEDEGGAAASGKSNAIGFVQFSSLASGRYFVRVDEGDAPFVEAICPVVVDVPGPDFGVTLNPLVAAVFRASSDDIICHTSFTSGEGALIQRPSSPRGYRVADLWRQRLRDRFRGASVVVGTAKKTMVPGCVARIHVFGRMCGWQDAEVPILPVSRITEATEIFTPSLGERAGKLTLWAVNSDGRRLDLGGESVMLKFRNGKKDGGMLMAFGESVPVPSGDLEIAPSSRMPMGAFPSRLIQMDPGASVDLEIAVRALWQVRVRPKLPNGQAPSHWGIRIGGDRKESLGIFQAEFSFWTSVNEIDIAVLSQGREPVMCKVARPAQPDGGSTKDLDVTLGPVTSIAIRR